MPASTEPTRVALLTPGETLPAWAGAAVERLLAGTDAEVTLVVEDATEGGRSTGETIRRLVELREWGVVAAAMAVLADGLPPLERVPVRDLDGLHVPEDSTASDDDPRRRDGPEWLRCAPTTVDGWKNSLPDRAVDRLAETDVALRFGFGFLVGDALDAPEHGVLSFHHGDLREYRGQPMGFWEFVHGRETAGVTLQRINETLDGGEIVAARQVHVGDEPTWGAVRCRLFEASEPMLAEGVRNVTDDDFEPEPVAEDELGDLYTLPRGGPVLTYLRKTARGVLVG